MRPYSRICEILVVIVLAAFIVFSEAIKIENVREVAKDAHSVTVEWLVAASDASSNDWIGYKIKYTRADASDARVMSILVSNLADKRVRIDSLRPFTDYKIQVSAINRQQEEGPASNMITIRTNEAVPGAPQDLKVNKLNRSAIEIEWKPPKPDELNGVIKGYRIQYSRVSEASSGGGDDVRTVKINDAQRTRFTLSELEPATTYRILVFAINSRGDGLRSSPLIVTTHKDLPSRPDNIRTQIDKDELRISWSMENGSFPLLSGYRLYFNNEIYHLDANANEISLRRPKWENDKQYELRLAAKSRKYEDSYGEEAYYLISTRKEQGKLSLNAEKVSQTSATLKWSIKLSSKEAISHYKLEYYLKSQANQILKIDQIAATKHEATLTNLRPNSVYIAQLVAIYSTPSQPPEEAITYFKTQSNDISPPRNLAIDRYEPDKVHIKWDKDESLLRIKSYRVYYCEISPDLPADATLIQLNPSLLWRQIDVNDVQNTELDIKVLDPRLTYAFKVVSIDHQGQESAESPVVLTPSKPSLEPTARPTTKEPSPNQNQMVNFAINDQIGVPREVDIMEFTSTSVKFSWIPPKNLPNSDSSYSFRISYVDHRKSYKDAQGIERTHSTGTIFNLLVPGRDDPSLKIMWLVNNLLPDTKYEFNISAVLSSQQSQGPAVTKTIKTKRDRPEFVSRPSVQGIYAADNTVLLKLGGASEKNGPIGSYWLVVVPQHDPSFFDSSPDRDLAKLQRVSINERDHIYSNESSYIAAEFESFLWPGEFLLGNGRQFGRFFNRPLIKGTDYKVYTIAFTEDGYQVHSSEPNMIGLGDVFSRVNPSSEDHRSELASSTLAIGDLFSLSQYSEVFNTKPFESRAVVNLANDYQNILWITGAVAALIIVFIIIAGVSIHLMNKNRRKAPMSSTNHMLTTTNTATTSSSASPTTLLLNSNGTHQMNTNTLSNGSKSIEATLSRKNPLGLLTTVTQSNNNAYQPIATSNPSPPQNNQSYINENLYTSIDIAQRQFLLTNAANNMNISNNNNNSYQIEASPLFAQSSFSNPQLDPIEMRRVQYSTAAMQSHPPIKVEELALYIDALKADANERFSEEYESIEPGQQFTWHASTLECNRAKNRYANVIAYDHSRVVLTNIDHHHQGSDYINANYLDGYRKRNAYIATQGPLPSTYGDFWRMIWEQRTSTIVMMTKLEERNRLKCDQYWPTRGTDVYDGIMQVSLVDLNELATYSIRTFVIANLKCPTEPKREIKHFQYTAWPDHGVPDHATPFLMFLRRVHAANPAEAGPLVVHCSAGVGRTGCFIVIDAMLERLKCEKSVDIYGYVTCLRSQRNYMVQTEDQYVFCYDAVLEAAQNGVTEVPATSLYVHLEQLLQSVDENCTLTEMELEYKRLSNIKAPQSKFQSANMPANKFKNRLVNILPYEATRVCLSLLSSGGSGVNSQSSPNQSFIEGSDYINANFIDGYRYRKAYIATQAPLSETIEDFWRMLWEHNSTIIVMLTKLREMGREKCAQYWPTERSIRYHYFVVDPIAEYNMSQYILREFKITDARDGQSRTIRQFQFVDWPEQGVPKSGESIIELIGQVHKTKEQFGQMGPITVHCSAGVGRTGVFLTLSIVLERMRYEGMIDVFNTVKMLRTQRPAMVQTEDQYQFCYRAALEYLGSFDNFDN